MVRLRDVKIDIPKYPKLILDTLHKNGYEAYIVGGCVRDALLGVIPSDYDITTNATPFEIKKCFKRTIDTGIKHGTVTVVFYEDNKPFTYEVTTYRIDGEYEDSRHPKEVSFVTNLKLDLLRRDFTVNAMAYNEEEGLVDEFGGLLDLDKGIIRAVGNPIDRFNEDALRLLRAIRFAAKLGFYIEDETKNAIPKIAPKIRFVSKERIQLELSKTISSEKPELVKLVFDLGLAPYISKEFSIINVGRFDKKLPLHIAYACLFYNSEISVSNSILRDLKLDNNTINKVTYLLSSKNIYIELTHDVNIKEIVLKTKNIINNLGYELSYDLITLLKINEDNNNLIDKMLNVIKECESNNIPIFLKDIEINGNDMMEIGFKGGEIGLALLCIQTIVFKYPNVNKHNKLMVIAKKAFKIYNGGKYEL